MTKQQSFFDNLKKIFSSTVIVRGEDNKLKIIDLDKIQAYNNLETNRAIDRYGRGYSGANYASSWNTTGDARYRPYNKMDLYKDYDTMDTDPILSTVLDIYSEESSLNNEYDDIITINTENKDLENVLSNLFYDILNIEFNLPIWIRSLVKYGDFFLKMDIVEKIGITNVYPLSPYGVDRFESPDGTNIRFTYDKSLGTGLSPGSNQFYDYEISHFRLISDAYYLPYGRSILEPARRMWKQLILMEDAMLLHRILRAPDRRAFYIDVGNIPPNEVEMYIKKVINETKRIPYMDPNTGQYNLRYNLMSLTDDLYMPVRGNSTGTKIETVPGLTFTGTEDIEYLRNRMMAALKVPASFLNYTQDVNTKSTLSAQDVRFARSVERVQKCILTELYKMAFVHLYSLGFELKDMVEFEISLTKSSKVYEMEKMLLWQSKIDLADKMIDTKLIPSKWIYQNVFDMNDEDIIELKQELINDTKFNTYLEKGLSKGQKINFRTPSQKEERARDKGVYKQIEHDKDEQLDDFMNPEDTPTTTKSLNKLKHNFKGKSPLATDLTQHELIYQNKK